MSMRTKACMSTALGWIAVVILCANSAVAQEIPPTAEELAAAERFAESNARAFEGAMLEVRSEASIAGGEILLRQVCRWSNTDARYFAPLADLKIATIPAESPFQAVTLDAIRQTLHDAGANLGVIRFSGAITCTVGRSDVKFDETAALRQWADARQGKIVAPPIASTPAAPVPSNTPAAMIASQRQSSKESTSDESPYHALRQLIAADAAVRLAINPEQLQMTFNPVDDRVLNLCEPQFRFNIKPRRVFGLGAVEWDVTIVTETSSKTVSIEATARAWQQQVVLTRPVTDGQTIRTEDVREQRVLTDRLTDEPLLVMSQCVGQRASRSLKPGAVMTANMVSPVELARPGQFITVTLINGGVKVKTVAVAHEGGSYGQTILAKNEVTGTEYHVILTGPQEGTISPMPVER